MSDTRLPLREATTIAVRRIGSGKVHRAIIDPIDLIEGSHWGAPCTIVALDPVAVLCGVVLKGGDVIRIPEGESLESWRRNKKVCKACEMMAR